jgi:hypothetical protein
MISLGLRFEVRDLGYAGERVAGSELQRMFGSMGRREDGGVWKVFDLSVGV